MASSTDKITFGRQGQINRDGIRVGWIERKDDIGPVYWRIRLTPASGNPGLLSEKHSHLRDAKVAAHQVIRNLV